MNKERLREEQYVSLSLCMFITDVVDLKVTVAGYKIFGFVVFPECHSFDL